MTTGERLTQLRKDAGYTRVAFAEKLGIPQTTLRNYEIGIREPGHSFLTQISKIFSVSTDYLLGLTDNKYSLFTDTITEEEHDGVKKYRTLDEHGKKMVDTVLDMELNRVKEIEEQHIKEWTL